MKTIEQIMRDVKHDWATTEGQAVIRRRWPKLTCPLEIQTAEMRQRWFLQQLPSKPFQERKPIVPWPGD